MNSIEGNVVKIPLPQPVDIPARWKAMMNALIAQRNQTADEVANLCGDIAEAREENDKLKARIAELEGQPPA